MFDTRGSMESRNGRSGVLQRSRVRRVWVDLVVAYPPRAEARCRPDPRGVDLSARVPGELMQWLRTTTGEWVGWCSVAIAHGDEVHTCWQYVPAAALSPT